MAAHEPAPKRPVPDERHGGRVEGVRHVGAAAAALEQPAARRTELLTAPPLNPPGAPGEAAHDPMA